MIAIVDYGLGNVQAIANVYKKLGLPTSIVTQAVDLKRADKVILPGVGAFDQAIKRLEKAGMRQMLDEVVLQHHVPVLGICVGMQMLARSSEEGKLAGLGWIDAEVKRFDLSAFNIPACVPHMGWNDVKSVRESGLFREMDHSVCFYFLHSYYMCCKKDEDVIAVADYGGEFACAVNSGNVYGVQFHPEKSHGFGLQLLKNFGEL